MHSPKPYQWLLFDADGTLFDYDRAEARALEGTFMEFSLPFAPEYSAAYQKINQQVWLDFENGQITSTALRVARFERLFAAIHAQADPEAFSGRYLTNLALASDLTGGAAEIVHRLREKYQLALITNGLKDVQRPRLANSAIAGCFAVVAISEELGAAKPDPRYFDLVFEQMGHPTRQSALVVGDSLTSDILGGINYGLDTCWYNPQRKPPDPAAPPTYEIHRLEEIFSILEE